jgi:hypothetical protein
LRQASRRSWRIGQRQNVEVTHLVYRGTLQAEALALLSSKMRSSLMIEGELPEDGLVALGGDDQDVMLALARRLADRSEDTEHSLEEFFARRRRAEADCAQYLSGEDAFASTVEPEPMVHAPGHGDLADWKHDSQATALIGVAEEAGASAGTRPISFDELTQLLRRPRPRRKAVPAEQLALFGDEVG